MQRNKCIQKSTCHRGGRPKVSTGRNEQGGPTRGGKGRAEGEAEACQSASHRASEKVDGRGRSKARSKKSHSKSKRSRENDVLRFGE